MPNGACRRNVHAYVNSLYTGIKMLISPVHLSLFFCLLAQLELSRLLYLPPWKQAEKHILRLHMLQTPTQIKAQRRKKRCRNAQRLGLTQKHRNYQVPAAGEPLGAMRSLFCVTSTPPSSSPPCPPPLCSPRKHPLCSPPGTMCTSGERINNGTEGTF